MTETANDINSMIDNSIESINQAETVQNLYYVGNESFYTLEGAEFKILRTLYPKLPADCLGDKCATCYNQRCGIRGTKDELNPCESCGEPVCLDDINEFGECPNCWYEEPSEIESWDFEC